MFKVQVGVVVIIYNCIQQVLVSNLSWDILSRLKFFAGSFCCYTGVLTGTCFESRKEFFFILAKCFAGLFRCSGGGGGGGGYFMTDGRSVCQYV
jgi:hypothetical protein